MVIKNLWKERLNKIAHLTIFRNLKYNAYDSVPQNGNINNFLSVYIEGVKMYEVKKRLEISAAHKLKLDYESKCTNLHGHNWIVDVYLRSETLDQNGMVMDFTHIKKKIQDKFDHKIINEVVDFNPTAENLAKFICDELQPFCYRVDVQESTDNIASYIK